MPQDASALERDPYDRVLFLGDPHIGKSTSIIASAAEAFGMGYVLNCGKKEGLSDAARRSKRFKWDLIRDEVQMEDALKDQTRNNKGESDGRCFWREYMKRLINILARGFDFKAHIYVISHYIETGGGLIDGQTEKTGPGVAPLFGGAARKEIPGMFADIVFMAPSSKDKGKRSFFINPVGVYGPSCLSLPGTHEIDADVGLLHEAFQKGGKSSPEIVSKRPNQQRK